MHSPASRGLGSQSDDLLQIFKSHQLTDLDAYVDFNIYFDSLLEADVKEAVSLLNKRLVDVYSVLGSIFAAYSWTCCPPFLEVVVPGRTLPKHRGVKHYAEDSVPCLSCRMRLGDNSEEQWLITFLLLRLTERFTDASIAIRDSDGEFLLMDAAFHIPSWLDPENSVNRVFLRQNALCLILRVKKTDGPASLRDALRLLRTASGDCRAKMSAQRCIQKRVEPYKLVYDAWLHPSHYVPDVPSSASATTLCLPHSCSAVVPLPVAVLLNQYPHLLGVALDYLPPQKDTSYCKVRELGTGNPVFTFQDATTPSIVTRLTFNRCQYARLQQLRFVLPMHFAAAKWTLPKSSKLSNKELREAAALGAKICLGLHCAYSAQPQGWDPIFSFFWSKDADRPTSDHSTPSHLDRFIQLVDTVAQLEEGEVTTRNTRHSPWQLLEPAAKDKPTRSSNDHRVTFSRVLKHVYRGIANEMTAGRLCSSDFTTELEADDVGWLQLNPDDVDALIKEKTREDRFFAYMKEASAKQLERHQPPEGAEGSDAFKRFRNLLNQTSGYAGIEQMYSVRHAAPAVSTRFQETMPAEFAELYETFEKDQDSFLSSDASITASDTDDITSSLTDDDDDDDDDDDEMLHGTAVEDCGAPKGLSSASVTMRDMMDAMDAELAQIEVEEPLSGVGKPSTASSLRPACATAAEIKKTFDENMVLAQNEEPFLDAGPATLLLKYACWGSSLLQGTIIKHYG